MEENSEGGLSIFKYFEVLTGWIVPPIDTVFAQAWKQKNIEGSKGVHVPH